MTGSVSVLHLLDDHAFELETTDPDVDGDGLRALGDTLADARVVALGESTHGTREFFQLKHRIVRELVTNHGCRTFAIEGTFGAAQRVNDYVRTGEGDPTDAIAGMYFWTWKTDEVRAFVEWLREFNRDRDRDDQVSFWGVDIQHAEASADALAEYLSRADTTDAVEVVDDLDELTTNGLHDYTTATDSKIDLDRARDIATPTVEYLESNEDVLVAATSDREYALARQHARAVEQAVEYATLRAKADPGEPTKESISYRDQAMASNVQWVLDRVDDDQLVLWAHNDHVKRGGMTRPEPIEGVQTTGDHLAERYRDDYHALGFAFGRGSFQAIGDLHDDADTERGLREVTVDRRGPDSLESTLGELIPTIGVLDVASARTDPTCDDWVDTDHQMRSIGAMYDHADADDYRGTYDLTTDFETLLYVDETTRARPFDD